MKLLKNIFIIFVFFIFSVLVFSCNSGTNKHAKATSDSLIKKTDSTTSSVQSTKSDTVSGNSTNTSKDMKTVTTLKRSKVELHYFHVTDRCAACIAIENVTRKTLNTYYKNELASGTIKLSVLNVDDNANKAISEKYQAFGSSLFVTKIIDDKETTTDLTGDGFKYAKNK